MIGYLNKESIMPRPRNTPEVLWSKVDKRGDNECWPWIGWVGSGGYGRFQIDGKSYYAHRAIFDLVNPGIIELNQPADRRGSGFILHKCDNPICCNPSHLRVGTQLENMKEAHERGRKTYKSGANHARALLTEEDVFWIRMHKKYGTTKKAISLLYDISVSTIKCIWAGKSYRD
jgi:hypothetical protein